MFNYLDTEIGDFIPNDSLRIDSLEDMILRYLENHDNTKILDLGCGEGKYVDLFKKFSSTYVGCDISSSGESKKRTRKDIAFVIYDGTCLPFLGECFNLIILDHVLEHIEKPYDVFKEISRVLKNGGYVIGSVSQLEPYHSHSLWNVTPYGLWFLAKSSSLKLENIRPGIDCFSLILGISFFRLKYFTNANSETIVNKMIYFFGKIFGKTSARINAAMLFLAGQYFFVIEK